MKPLSRFLAIGLFLLITILIPAPLPLAHASASIPRPDAQTDFSHRYVILLDGVNSSSSGTAPLGGDFEFIESRLIQEGIPNENIVYFSYSATAKDNFCLGWKDGCTADMDLSYLYLFPVYGKPDTHLKITHQAETLKWLIGQVIKKDLAARIDIIGFSQGGVIAAYLGSKITASSSLHDHIHGIITIESPLGGLPAASTCFEGQDDDLCFALRFAWGEELLRALQLPGSMTGSLVDDFPDAAENFRFTAIVSKFDYTVNGVTFPIAWPFHGHQDALIGMGSQFWVKSKQKLHYEELGGKGLATDYMSWSQTYSWILANHFAPLKEQRTADWIVEALSDSPASPPDIPSIPSISWGELETKFLDWWQQQTDQISSSWNEWLQEQEQKITDAFDDWWQDVQRQLARELEQQWTEWLNQCFGSALLPMGATVCVWMARIVKRKRP